MMCTAFAVARLTVDVRRRVVLAGGYPISNPLEAMQPSPCFRRRRTDLRRIYRAPRNCEQDITSGDCYGAVFVAPSDISHFSRRGLELSLALVWSASVLNSSCAINAPVHYPCLVPHICRTNRHPFPLFSYPTASDGKTSRTCSEKRALSYAPTFR